MQQQTPIGCWNCRYANIDGDRPTEGVPGTRYRTGCHAPQRSTPGAIGTAVMVEANIDLPVCQWHEAL